MDIRRLQGFVAVAEELHFGRAAQRLHMSQPPLSMLIRSLEAELGTSLFRRTSRRVELTDGGRVLLEDAREILARLDRAHRRTAEAGRGERSTLTIGFITPMIYSLLPAVLRVFRVRYPNVRLVLREAMSDVQLEALQTGELSVGFVASPVSNETLAYRPILTEPLIAAMPVKHALGRSRSAVSLRELAEQPFVLFPRASAPGLFDEIVGFCRSVGFSPRIDQEAVQSQTIVSLVSAGLGVAIVPESIGDLRRTGVVYRRFRERSPKVSTLVAWRREDLSPALVNFLGVLKDFSVSPRVKH